jgi:hypothetical protein
MASAVDTNKLRARLAVHNYFHDVADATVATKIAWVDLGVFENFLALVTVTSGAVVTFKIFAATSAAGAGAVVVKEHATPTTADAAGDSLVLECSAAELPALGDDLRYVGVELDMNGANDLAVVTYVRANPRHASGSLTADAIS